MTIDPRGIAAAIIESQRVEYRLAALGFDRIGIAGVQQQIADLFTTTTLSWRDATDQIMDRILSGSATQEERER